MGKSLNGKESGTGISQRKGGLYQARFMNRFGKRRTICAKTVQLNGRWCKNGAVRDKCKIERLEKACKYRRF